MQNLHAFIGFGINRTEINQLFAFIFGNELPRGVKKSLYKGYLYAEKNELQKAKEEFGDAIKNDYKQISYEIRSAKAEILNYLKESPEEAINLCNEAIRIADKIPIFQYIQARGLTWIHKADAHFLKKEYDLALKCIKIAIHFMPDSPITWFCQGAYLMEMEAYNEALESFEITSLLREVKEGHPFAVDFEFKGKVLLKLGRNKEAYSCFQEVLKLEPENKIAKEQISLLKSEL